MPFDHILLCDCLPTDSILGEASFSIRASSFLNEDNSPNTNHPLLQETKRLLSYDLPPAYGRSQPDPKTAPIRLAAIPIKEHNVVALSHTVYVPFDTRGRPNSYFTHVIFIPYDQFTWRDALKTWGKIQWEINLEDIPEDPAQAAFFKTPHWLAYWPPHATQVLPKLDFLPNSGLDDSLLNSLFTPRPDETYWKNLLSHLCHTIKDPAKLAQPGGSDNEKEKNGVLGYLLRREAPPQDGEELTGETIRATGAPTLHPNLGQSMEETFRHLLLAAYLFPVELTRPFGFSTYEPESQGVGIARGRLLAALVKSADEPENDFLKDSLGYYPNPPGNETQNQEAEEATGHYFADLPPGLLEAFTKSSIPVQKFAEEINFLFQGYNGKEWKTFENSLTLFWRLQSAKKNCDYKSTVILTQKKYWDNSHVKKEFEELMPQILLPYANKCREGLTQTPHELESLKILADKDFFPWEDVCACFCSKEFWQPFLQKAGMEQGKAFLIYSRFFINLCSHLVPRLKDPLLNALYSLFTKGILKEFWKNNEVILEALGDLFTKQNKFDLAQIFFETAKQSGQFGLLIKKIEETKTPQSTREEMALALIQQTLLTGQENKWLKEKNGLRIFTGVQFSRAIANLFQTKEQEILKRFFGLMKGPGNSGFFTATMKNLLSEPGITDKDNALFREILHTEEYLYQEVIQEFLFKCDSPQSIKIITQLQRVPGWLKQYLESFLKALTWESFITPGNVNYGFPFDALFEGLNNAKGECPDFTVVSDGLNLRESLKDFPDQFNKKLFSQTRWAKGSGKKENEKIVEFLWEKIGDPPATGYYKEKAQRVMDLIGIKDPNRTIRNSFSYDSLAFGPPLRFAEKKKILIAYSLLKHGLITKITNLPKEEKMANLFRKNDTIIGNLFPFESDTIGLILHWFRWLFVLIFCCLACLNLFYPQNSLAVKLSHGFMIFTCFLWGCESLFSKLNNLAPREIAGQKFIATIWAIIGITFGALGFPFAFSSPPHSNIAFAVGEFVWLAIFAGMYKNGAERFLECARNDFANQEKEQEEEFDNFLFS